LRQKWNERLFKEMYFGYLQGRSEKDPTTKWYEGELWFFDFYVLPLARKLKECGVFGVSSEEYLDYAVRNRTEWARKGKEISESMLERAMIEARKKGLKRMDSVVEDDEELSDSERSVSNDVKPDVAAEPAVSNDVKPDVAAEPATDFVDEGDQESDAKLANEDEIPDDAAAAAAGEAVEAESTKPAWIVLAPPGKLGIIIDTTVEGPVVHRVSVGSVMKLKLASGDLIAVIDGVKTLGLSAEAISTLMSSRVEHERILTIQKSQSKGRIPSSATGL
jgi:hypothetical protein